MTYRPDIDGLRAIAILLVLIYHGGLALFPAGFIGVDIFFVISGFLITGIIHESLKAGNFSFVDFYNRRLWRLQPVFLCLILITSLLTLLFFLPDDLVQYSRSSRKTSLFISNIFFNQTTTGYFSPDAHQLPLLHTWSLSIEWQCYFILPLVMYLLHRIFKPQAIIYAVFILAIISLFVALHYSSQLPAQTYYQLSSRIFEFLIGACIALIPFKNQQINPNLLNMAGAGALVSIFYVATLDNILLGYPNYYALLVCLATGLLIAIGKMSSKQIISKLLAIKPLVFIGLLSYSLYIWHWVIFAMLRYQTIQETTEVLFLAYSLIALLSYCSWRYVEQPARHFKHTPFRYTLPCLILLPLIITHSLSYLINKNLGYPQRFNDELVMVYDKLKQYSSAQRPLCISNKNNHSEDCILGAKAHAQKKALMIGDSFSNHYWGFMDTIGQAAGVSIVAQGVSSCITLPGISLFDWWHFKNHVYQECKDDTAQYYRWIQRSHYDYVIIGQIWGNYLADNIINKVGDARSVELSKQRLEIALDKALEIITHSGAKPVLIKTTALMQQDFKECFFKHIKLRQPYNANQCQFHYQLSTNELWFNRLFTRMKAKYPQLILIDPKKVQCQNAVCNADIDGVPVYRDAGHITDYASYQLGKRYIQRYGNPLV